MFFQAEDGIRDRSPSRGLGDVYKRQAKSPIRTIEKIITTKKGSKIIIIFKSKSFLQQQVRSMVGCLKMVGEAKWSLKKFKNIMNLKKRENCAPPAPPRGLYLLKVSY